MCRNLSVSLKNTILAEFLLFSSLGLKQTVLTEGVNFFRDRPTVRHCMFLESVAYYGSSTFFLLLLILANDVQ